MRRLGLWVLLWLGCSTALAQSPYLRNWGHAHGLPSLQIYDLQQHSSGYLYLGTMDGLLRFNGQQFEGLPFEKDPSVISYLKEDVRGRLWGRDFSNQLFYLENDTVKRYEGLQEELNEQILTAYDLEGDTLWMATENLVYAHDLRSGKTSKILQKLPANRPIILDLKLSGEYVVVSTAYELLLLDRSNGDVLFQQAVKLEQTELLIHDQRVYFANRGLDSHRLYEFDLQKLKLRSCAELPNHIYGNYVRWWQNGLFWCTNQGLFQIDLNIGKVEPYALTEQRISDLWSDEAGHHWISTLDHGLYQMPLPAFRTIFRSPYSLEQLKTINVGGDDALLVGSHQGRVYKLNKSGQLLWEVQTLKKNEIQFVFAQPEKNIVYSSEGLIEANSGRLTMPGYFGSKLIEGGNQQLLLASQYGVFVLRDDNRYPEVLGERDLFHHFKVVRMRKKRAYDLAYSKELNQYLVAYTDGLYRYDLKGNAVEIKDSLHQSIIARHLLPMSNGQFWLSTPTRGIQISDGKQILLNFNTSHGLSSNNVKKIVYAGDAKCWVLTDKGLDLYDGHTGRFQPYRDALALGRALLFDIVADDSLLYIASSVGILGLPLHPAKIALSPRLVMRKALFNGQELSFSADRLPQRRGQLQLQLDALMFSDQSNLRVQYRVLPDQPKWVSLPPGMREISLFDLPGGTNTIELRLAVNDEYSDTFRWKLYVPYPIWLQWWFLLLLLAAIVSITSLLTRYFNRRRQSAHALQQQLAGSQLTAIKAQMNPHFMYNVLNAIQGLIYANKKEEAADYLAKFSDLMRLTLNVSDKQWHNLNDEISALTLYLDLEASRFNGEFRYQIDLEPELRQLAPDLPSMLLQPFLENAIKHGLLHKTGPKWLRIGFHYAADNELMTIEIEDNGIGRKAGTEIQSKRAPKHRSFATGAIESRIQILNRLLPKPIHVETIDKLNAQQMPTGTLVILRIPLTKA